ncbi:4-alpha-glucanotransferase [candidate division KSB1 bacterium]|nr:4-alpha-glucanotransferase [candidate division KSB1 bacterium]
MKFKRASGILLHPTSFPGKYGIGELGSAGYEFIDFLSSCAQKLWQVMPLGPTGYGDSPYACFSAFAGNHLLISLDELVRQSTLSEADIADPPPFPDDKVDYGSVIDYRSDLLRKSFENFMQGSAPALQEEFDRFCRENQSWLDDYALFMALKESHRGASWDNWGQELATRQKDVLQQWRQRCSRQILAHKYYQFEFLRQWYALKDYANSKGIKIIGDIPIFVAYDSADVWANPELFYLDEKGKPELVAGVPPDYFSETGQRWGNPLYRWDVAAKTGYAWWLERIKASLKLVDILRIDHFRGFESYWEIPASEATAIKGRWVKGPGAELFNTIKRSLGKLPIIAEDLGVITPEVDALRDSVDFPGMRVLQFAFSSDASNRDLPHNYPDNCVVYTGTHDNDTTMGWFNGSCTKQERRHALQYIGVNGKPFNWALIQLAMSSVANLAIIPLQDVLGLGTDARMNFPSTLGGNWAWRYRKEMLNGDIGQQLRELTELYGR